MEYRPTGETVTFVEGHNQFGPNSLSHHAVFLGSDGEFYIPKPGKTQAWLKLADVQKPIHDAAGFLKTSTRTTGRSVSEQTMADAYKPTTEIQRVPQKILKTKSAQNK